MIYECQRCGNPLPAGVTACPYCGTGFSQTVPEDAEIPKPGAQSTATASNAPSAIAEPGSATSPPMESSDSQAANAPDEAPAAAPLKLKRRFRPLWLAAGVLGIVLVVLVVISTQIMLDDDTKPKIAFDSFLRITEAMGGFSYVPPSGWHVRSNPGLKYRIVCGPRANGLTPVINFVDETRPVTLDEYVRLTKSQLQHGIPGYKLLSQSPFLTESGIQGFKLVADVPISGRDAREICYILPGHNSTFFDITAVWTASGNGKYEHVADACIKTFQLD